VGLTAHEIAQALDVDRASIQLRLSELRRKGLVVDSGQRRRNESGKRAIVWLARPDRANG
jgi:predicted transcriptional regulator